MNRAVATWAAGFGASLALAIGMIFWIARPAANAPRDAAPSRPSIAPKDPSKVSDVELELLLNRIREGDLHALRKDLDSARKSWAEARQMGAGLWPIHEGIADSLARAGLFDEAVEEYRTAEALVPRRQTAHLKIIVLKRAEAHAAGGRPMDALRDYLEADQPARLSSKILEQASKVADSASAEKAIADRARLLDARVYQVLSAFYERLDRKPDAAEALARFVIAEEPWREDLNRQILDVLRTAGKVDLAVDLCRAWARAVPGSVEPYRAMGDLLKTAGRERESVVAYSSIVDLRPDDPQAHRMMADLLRQANRPDDAIAQLEAAVKLKPEDESLWGALLPLIEGRGDPGRFEETAVGALRRFPESSEFRTRVGAIYENKVSRLKAAGKETEARDLRRRMAELNMAELGLFDLKVIMTWDAPADVDLDVYEPGGERVGHANKLSRAGGRYFVDDMKGRGPETYTIAKAQPGLYQVGAHLHTPARTKVRFVVILYEDTDAEERREETVILDKVDWGDKPKFIRDIVIPR
jgi:tetratricopeptide (TPR) repeat protein